MNEIKTYTGAMFAPLHPNPSLIDIRDVAHALSLLCRANGHFRNFYSVGQHSVNCAKEARARGCSEKVQLACLLHDASEAYLSDVARPVKRELPQYREMEQVLQDIIWKKYLGGTLSEDEHKAVFAIDDAMLYHEFVALMDMKLYAEEPELKTTPIFAFDGFEKTEAEFLRIFRLLTGGSKECFVVGIDWMKPYWLAAEIRGDEIAVRTLAHISEINALYLDADAVLIDIPIGLPENPAEDSARPDREARSLLAAERKSTIFPVPCRQAVFVDDYARASAENEYILGRKLTSQSHGFSKTIRQVDVFLAESAAWSNRLVESHPEVAFQLINDGNGLHYSKHSAEGIAERVEILQRNHIDATPILTQFKAKQHEDVLDALCLALSAKLGCENGFRTIPDNPVCDSHGLKMQMCFGK